MDNILENIKKLLGIPSTDTAFDVDILVLINNSIAILKQLGVGPQDTPLVVESATDWSALTDNTVVLAMSKTLIYVNTKLAFDPPGNSFTIESYKKLSDELVWRIQEEANPYIPPEEPVP